SAPWPPGRSWPTASWIVSVVDRPRCRRPASPTGVEGVSAGIGCGAAGQAVCRGQLDDSPKFRQFSAPTIVRPAVERIACAVKPDPDGSLAAVLRGDPGTARGDPL